MKKTRYKSAGDKENDRLLNLYPNLKFSKNWTDEMIPRYMKTEGLSFEEMYNKWKIYYTKSYLEPFSKFYDEYKPFMYPKNVNGYDMGWDDGIKNQFDKIINGDLYVDEEFLKPLSPIRNYCKMFYYDKINIDSYNQKNKIS